MTPADFIDSDANSTIDASVARDIVGACIGGLLIAAIEFAVTRASVEYSVLEQVTWLARLSVHWVLAALPVGVAFWSVERRAAGANPPGLAYAAAVTIGAVAGASVMALHGKFVDPAIARTAVGFDMELADRFLYGFWQLAFWGSVGAMLHASDLRHRRSAIALRKGELARLRSERRLAEARLAALHAQLEPEFILTTLDSVERLYTRDVAGADRVLDALILFLREATPLLRRQESTVDQECRMLHLYLRVLGAASGLVGDVSIATDPSARDVAVPPGILVSLAQQVLVAVSSGPAHFAVRMTRRRDGYDLELSATAASIECTAALRDFVARTENRLRLSDGPQSSIALLQDAPGGIKLRIALIK